MYRFQVPSLEKETKLRLLAGRMLPELPEYIIRQAFARRDVKMDGLRVGRDAIATPGAHVCLYSSWTAGPPLAPILYQDCNLLLVRKPLGLSCQADTKGGKTIASVVGDALRLETPGQPDPLPCHRLDNQTDGLLLLAKTNYAQELLMDGFRQRQIHKTYICLVKGTPFPAHALLHAYLRKDAARGRSSILYEASPGAVPISTEYQVLQAGLVARLSVTLHTGRTHQIRAHLASQGHPILGDDAYGDRGFTKSQRAKRLMLCATGLSFALEGPLAYLNSQTFSTEPLF